MVISRILIVGHGSIGRRHLRLARQFFPDADIRVLRHQRANEVPAFSNGLFFNLKEAIEFHPELAVIAGPSPFHIHIAQALAKAGSHLLIEKPLSNSLDGAKDLIEICKDLKRVLAVGYNLRFSPSLQYFRKIIRESVLIGGALSFRCEAGQYLPSWRPEADYTRSVSASKNLGGGVLLELSHEIDYLNWIFGSAVWVKASLSRQSNLMIDVEDTAHLTLCYRPSGELKDLIGTVSLDFIRHDTTRMCWVIGETGTLRWNGVTNEVHLFESQSNEWRLLFGAPQQRDESYILEWENFIECIAANKKPLVTGDDGLRVLEVIESSRESSDHKNDLTIIRQG